MLWECWQYLRTPCEPWAREIGFLYESVATGARYRRCRKHWEPHLQNSRRFILQAAEPVAARGRVIVLGSGWLLDVPLEELASRFGEVVLVDAVHPRPSMVRAGKFRNVRLLRADVTGWAQPLVRREGGEAIPEPPPIPQSLRGEGTFDLVVSVNLLSQLALKPFEWIERKPHHLPPPGQFAAWQRRIERGHRLLLESLAGTRCLITDTDFQTLDSAGTCLQAGRLLLDADLPPSQTTWEWDIIPRGERSPLTRTRHRVQAVAWNAG